MQNSPVFGHPDLNKSGLQNGGRAGSPSTIPTLSGIDTLRASTSSTSTGASPDDTSTESPDWPGTDDDALKNYTRSHMLDPPFDMTDIPPKIEELDEELQNIKTSGVGREQDQNDNAGAPVAVPRKRGRPRKHPLPSPGGQPKITKGRSKTGCVTCRRRKKKCDETKPA